MPLHIQHLSRRAFLRSPANMNAYSAAAAFPARSWVRVAGANSDVRGVAVGNLIECEGGSVVTTEAFSATTYDKAG